MSLKEATLLDTLTLVLPYVILFNAVRYLAAVSLMYFVSWSASRAGFGHRRIQRRLATRQDHLRELVASAQTIIVFALVVTPVLWLRSNGFAIGRYSGSSTFLEVVFYVAALLVAHDAWFYWTHRLMHLPSHYKRMHRTHHRSVTPTPLAAYAFDWKEAIVQAGFVALWVLLIPTPKMAMILFLWIMILRNVVGHSGIELHPRGFADHWFWGLFTTTVHHDLHHSGGFATNFGLYFTWWDRLMGTEHLKYRQVYREVTMRKATDSVTRLPRLRISEKPLQAARCDTVGSRASPVAVGKLSAKQAYLSEVRLQTESCSSQPDTILRLMPTLERRELGQTEA